MKNLKYTLLTLSLIVTFASCKKDTPGSDNKTSSDATLHIAAKDLVVPASFNFQTEKDLQIRVGVANAKPNERYIIKIYNSVPSTNALISTGITDANGEYNTNIRVGAWEEFIYIEKINPDGSRYFEKVKANLFVSALFNNNTPDRYIVRKSGSGMTCNTGCTSTVSNLSASSTVNSGKKICYTGTLNNATIVVKNGGTAKICGTGTIASLTIQGSAAVYFLEGSQITIASYTGSSSSNYIKNWSDSLTFSDSVTYPSTMYNYGNVYVTGNLITNYGSFFWNEGNFNVTGNQTIRSDFYNYNSLKIGGTFNVTSSSTLRNFCSLNVAGDMIVDKNILNCGAIKVGETFTQNSGTNAEFSDGAILKTKNFVLSGESEGTGSNRSKIKVSATTTINSGAKVKGGIDLCDSTGIETNNGSINSPAALSCAGYIAPSTCFPDGFGQPAIQDADNDGVADAQDEYPNDATRAFNSYYPSANSTATLAFEDLWPATGDYDFNDLVLAFNIQKVLNANNDVVDYKVKMKVLAIGASYDNGFGFRLDEVLPAEIASVSGQVLANNIITRSANGTEAAQDRAVIICYDSPEPSIQRVAGSMFNTIATNGVGTSDTVRVNISFTTPIADSKLGIAKFNPFIFTNQRRGYEVHLGNFKPTSLATTSLFGTSQDRTNNSNVFYKTANGMPWAILLPENFVYPTERTEITDAYNFFDDWAASGGTNYTNWYTNAPGNRNNDKLFGQQ